MVSIEKRKFGFRKRTGTKLLRDIINNDSAVDISEAFTESKNGAAEESFYVSVDDPSEEFQNSINGVGVGWAVISFNPMEMTSEINLGYGEKLSTKRQTILAHELIHAYHDINGTSASLSGELEIRYPSEFQAVGIYGYERSKYNEKKFVCYIIFNYQ